MKVDEMLNSSLASIVIDDFSRANIFYRYGLDFYCNGQQLLKDVIAEKQLDETELLSDLQGIENKCFYSATDFKQWPLDLLIDYIVKRHHRMVYNKKDDLLALVNKVLDRHKQEHSELVQIRDSLIESIQELGKHFRKEENILFPFIIKLYYAAQNDKTIEPMHCNTVLNPINQMHMEHEHENQRYRHIIALTNNFMPPFDADEDYIELYNELETFILDLFEHIHIENNIIFPQAVELEKKVVV